MIHIEGNYNENLRDCLLIYEEIMIDIRGNYNKYMFLILKPNNSQFKSKPGCCSFKGTLSNGMGMAHTVWGAKDIKTD